ncbi:response regulator transcription factor [Sutterella megalosphaeroides]|uniref:DNA-binding response regulator n=1 Tax=Sutterella megalosphaeroides TaxID=2494234 RepID=A0A2Z6IBI8_9BURK|nr:response regulator [Sutterella megalosphaeroides]BBF23784.1 DNA-binding response regulator [Sutterella megalosphaeroides]
MNFTNLSGNFEYKPLIRVIDDDDAVRRSWAFLLSGESYDVVTYADAGSFLASSDFRRYGAILLDVRMPNMSGLELQNRLKELGCDLPIIFVSGHGDIDMAVNTLKNGAVDFLQKPVKDDRLLEVIDAAVARNKAARRDQAEVADFKARLEQLTQREREVIRMVAQGYSNKEVAAEFGISEKTVQVHRGSAYRKLDLHNAAEIARLLLRSGDPL